MRRTVQEAFAYDISRCPSDRCQIEARSYCPAAPCRGDEEIKEWKGSLTPSPPRAVEGGGGERGETNAEAPVAAGVQILISMAEVHSEWPTQKRMFASV